MTTEVTMTGTKTEKSMEQGGDFIVNNFKAVVETGRPTLSGRMILLMIQLAEPFSPKRCRSELWPLEGGLTSN